MAADEHGGARADFLSALARMEAGKPTHPELLERHIARKLRINPLTVSMEANRSRTLIGSPNCALPDVRQRVLESNGPSTCGQLFRAQLVDVKKRLAEYERQLRLKDTLLAAQQGRIGQLEEHLRALGVGVDEKVVPITRSRKSGRRRL